MLSIKNVRGKDGKAGGMADYPEQGLTMKPGDNAGKKDAVLSYYQGAEDRHGIWFGVLAEEMGYPKLVDHDVFVDALEGRFRVISTSPKEDTGKAIGVFART